MDFTHMKGFKFLKAILLVLLISCNDNSNIKKETIPTEDTINKIDVIENNLKKKIVLQPKNILSSNSIPKLGHTVNTIAYEYLPVLNKNRDRLFFTGMDRTGFFDFKLDHIEAKSSGGEDIYYCDLVNGIWSDARPIEILNTNSHESVSYVTSDNSMLITANYDENLGLKTASKGLETTDIFIAKPNKSNYAIEHLAEPVNSLYFESDAILDNTESYLLFASDRPGGVGEYHKKGWLWNNNLWGNTDIYVATKNDYGWSSVINLGDVVNTPMAERFPWLSQDGLTLFISSNAYSDSSDMDVLAFTRASINDWVNWEGPFLIENVNTPEDDIGFKLISDSIVMLSRAINLDFKPTMMGRGGDGGVRETNYRSGYKLYGCQTVSLKRDQTMDIYVSNINNSIYTLEDISFDLDSYKIKKDLIKDLQLVVDYLSMNKEKDVIIIGYTDDIGESEYNKELSYKRAKSVRDKLIELGMTNKVSYEGKGEENPKFSNSSKNKNKNRRVEISFE